MRPVNIDSSVEAGVYRASSNKSLVHDSIQMKVNWVATHPEGLPHMPHLYVGQVSLSNLEYLCKKGDYHIFHTICINWILGQSI